MKNFENIPKKLIFEAPDGYFDQLPGIIQSRVAVQSPEDAPKPYLRYAVQYALPTVLLLAVVATFFLPRTPKSAEALLALVETEQLVVYLEESDIGLDELIEAVEFDEPVVSAIEDEVYNQLLLEDLSDDSEFDMNNL